MLIGTTHYFDAATGHRTRDMDSNTPDPCQSNIAGHIAVWVCENGPNEERIYDDRGKRPPQSVIDRLEW